MPDSTTASAGTAGIALSKAEIIADYRLAYRSRVASLVGRKEVLGGKAKFGIFGDGKEVPQAALARAFRPGDIRVGYYRDQTMMLALGMVTVRELFAQLYADPEVEHEPSSAGRQMNAHFSTRHLNPDGSWKDLTSMPTSAADVSPTGSQMPRTVGLAYASKLYRELPELARGFENFSHQGNEVTFGTIGNASCAEGMFWEAVNAVGVIGGPLVLSIWDDGYGISVANDKQVTKNNIGALLEGFRRGAGSNEGYDLYTVKGWDYPALVETYARATATTRAEHVPAIIHVTELTQPQGHSTSGSHERYKSKERLAWEAEYCCVRKMREWMIAEGHSTADELDALEAEDRAGVEAERDAAWRAFFGPIERERDEAQALIEALAGRAAHPEPIRQAASALAAERNPVRRDIACQVRRALLAARQADGPARDALREFQQRLRLAGEERYDSHVHSQSAENALAVPVVPARYDAEAPVKSGFEVINACFDAALARLPNLIAFGEDVGQIGDVNQGFAGLQDKYGPLRVSDTGIRECTIVGQAIGMAMRGLRPIAEIQYLDYLLYALQIMSDDLATVQYRTKGGQKAPVIVRTRGHRLEGIWHSGSLMASVLNLLNGMYVCVPRNLTQAAGMYNTMLAADEPALIVEVLNAYRLKERLPSNIGEFTVPLGVPEVMRPGTDLTLVTYGACVPIALGAARLLAEHAGIEVEVIDVQTLIPFDREQLIRASLARTNRLLVLDEDMPGGTSAYMLQHILEVQGGYYELDSAPRTLAAKPHRPAYGSDGDYWSKPSVETVFEAAAEILNEADPARYPIFFR